MPTNNPNIEYYQLIRRILSKGNPPLAHVHSFGCQQNVADGEHLRGMLGNMGYGFTDTPENASLVIYNTCAVRENAEDRVFGIIGELKHNKSRNPNMITALCGCMVQQEHVIERIKRSYPQIDLVFGTHVLHEFPKLIYETLTKHKRIFNTSDERSEIYEGLPIQRESTFSASVSIMYGCNNFCTYCIVPYVRGRERSRKAENIIAEARQLVSEGYKEILLLGQNVNSYNDGDVDFPELLRLLNSIEGEFRINFMTSHPKDASHKLIDTIAQCEKVSRHFHLPVQSGSNRILSLMNRGYTKEKYMELVDYAKSKIPDICFTSDIIIGFPDEQHEDFLQTLELVRCVNFTRLFTFIYSKREGTKAANMEDIVPYKDKNQWFTSLLSMQQEIVSQKMKTYIGKTLHVLADGIGRSSDGLISGKSDEGITVEFKGDNELIGSFLHIEITGALSTALIGKIKEK